MPSRDSEPAGHRVVISGISGRFPKSDNVLELQHNLMNKVDCTTTNHGRWKIDSPKVPQRLGVCNNIGKFDRVFFGVHTRLTAIMDPGSRLLLEHCFEAFMDAGLNPRKLKGASIGVFTATNLSESEKTVFHHKVQQDGFGIMGSSKAMIPNRISFFFNLIGPSVHMDGGGAGAAAALERAYHAIKNGDCDGAIVAGSILSLHPHVSYQLKALGVLSTDGKTRSFDDRGDGGTRSEGVAVLFLQRASEAKRIYEEILGVKFAHTKSDLAKCNIFPKPEGQIDIMKEMLNKTGLTPDDISFLEASGYGRRDRDAEELQAIDAVYGKRKNPLYVGSVKSNLGDAVPVNTINSIIKMIIASETGQIPPNINFEKPNSKALCLKEGKIRVLTEPIPWTGQYCSINTTSTGGVFGNVILKTPNIKKKNNGAPSDDLPRLVIVSGRTEEAVNSIIKYMESRPLDVEFLQLLYDIFQSEIDAHLFRGYTIIPAKGLPPTESQKSEILFNSGEKREIWWIFSGMGSQWVGMGEALLKLPVFEAAIRRCDAVLKPRGFDIFQIITEKDPKMFDLIINSFVGIAAIQIGLVDVLKAVGLEPDFIMGHSVGELGCAYADGCFTAEQMILAALSRGLASTEVELQRGSMAAVGLCYEDIKPLCPPDIDVACHNGHDSSTISGPAESMKTFVTSLTAKGIFAREVPCSNIAYHSRYIAAAGPKLLERLLKVIPKPNPRSSKWVSSSVPRGEWNTLKARLSSAEYHTNNLLSPVLFEETSRLIPPKAICIEIAPHGLLQAILKRSLPESCINITLTRRGHPDNLEVLLTGLGKMYNVGLQPQIENLYPKIQYPVSTGTPSVGALIKWEHSNKWLVNYYTPVEDIKEGERNFEINLNDDDNKYLQGNIINGRIAVPLSLYLCNAWEVVKNFDPENANNVIFEDIKMHKLLLTIPDNNIISLTVMIPKGTGKFEVIDSETLIVSGTVRTTKTPSHDRLKINILSSANEKYELSQEDFYNELQMRGFQYSGNFRSVYKASIEGTGAVIKWNDWVTFIDGALQVYTFGNDSRNVEMPISIRKIIIDHKQQESAIGKSNEIQAVVNRKVNYLSAGGLEIQGLKLSILPTNLEQNKLTSDTLNIVPNLDNSSISLAVSLRLILQMIIENTFSTKIQRIQLIKQNEPQRINRFNVAMYDIPEASLFKIETIQYEEATFNKALTVITSDLKNYNLHEVSKKLGDGKFLLIYITNKQEDSYIKALENVHLKVIFARKFANESIILLRKKRLFNNLQVINVSKNIVETVNKIKCLKISSENERVVILIRSQDNIDVPGLIEILKNSINLEKIRLYDIQNVSLSDNPFADNLYKSQLDADLLINILTPRQVWATYRQTQVTLSPRLCINWRANKKYSHDPFSIVWTEGPSNESTGNIIKVEYSALNSQDILIANRAFYSDASEMTGKNRLSEASLGLEFSGIDSKGNRVMGITCGNSMSNIINADESFTWNIPESWSLEDAATVPLSYIVAYSTLVVKTKVEAGQKVMLTHSCNGLGFGILHLAVAKKCDVFVAYETEAEKKFIQSAYPNIPNNRFFKLTGDNFRDEVLLVTEGKGVDVVISNQSEIKKLEVFFTMIAASGTVVLISDLNENKIHEYIGMEVFLKEIGFYTIVPQKILRMSDSKTKNTLVDMLRDGINSGYVKPLPRITYSRDSLNEAFNICVAQTKFEKILVKVQPSESREPKAMAIPRLYCTKNKSYLIIEGLSSFGLELIDWLITRGARRFVIASALKDNNGYTKLRLKLWQNYGVKIVLHKELDLSQQKNIKILFREALSLGPIDAIFDLRRTDSSLKTTASEDSLNLTTKIVEEESRSLCPELRLFVICSLIQNLGKSISIKNFNTKSQDQIIEDIILKRKKDGFHGLIIRWGLIDDFSETKVILPPVTKYLQKFDEILGTEKNVVDVHYVDALNKEVEEDLIEINENTMDEAEKDAKDFTAGLYEQYGVHVEGYAYLQV